MARGPGSDKHGFPVVLSYRSSVLHIRGVAVNASILPGTVPGAKERPGFLFVVFHEQTAIQLPGQGEVNCKAGDMIILSPGRLLPPGFCPCRTSWLKVDGAWVSRLLSKHKPLLDAPLHLDDQAANLRHLVGIYRYLFLHQTPQRKALCNLLQNWLMDLERSLRQVDKGMAMEPVLLMLHGYIHRAYDQPWHLQDLTRIAGLSASNLISHFKKSYGYTPIQYIIRLRMLHAAEAILHGHRSVAEAAMEVGQENIACFSRNFKKHIGASPETLRRGKSSLDRQLIRALSLERALILARQGMESRRIVQETGFKDIEALNKAFEAEYGRSPENIRRAWAASQDLTIPDGLVQAVVSGSWHSPNLCVYSTGERFLHKVGIEKNDEDFGSGFLFMIFHDDVQVELSGKWADCPAGSMVILPSHNRRCYGREDRSWSSSWAWVGGPWLNRLLAKLNLPIEQVIHLPGSEATWSEFQAFCCEMVKEPFPEAGILRNLLENWLLEINRYLLEGGQRQPPNSLAGVKYRMEHWYRERFDLTDMADMACFSPSYFSKSFKDLYGMAPLCCLTRIRMLQAFSCLAAGNDLVLNTAREVGYADVDKFTEHFKAHFGVTPSTLHFKATSSHWSRI